jgi:hypothetical protein
MKKIIILNSYHSSDYHLEILKECLRRLKMTDYKLLLTSHLPIPMEIQSQVDYCVYDSENIMTNSASHYWYANSEFRVTINQPGHSIAICRNMIAGINLANTLGYKYFYFTECDNLFQDEDLKSLDNFFNEMISQNKKMIFHQQGPGYHTLLFGGEIEYFINCVHLPRNTEEYNSYTQNGCLEMDFFHHLSKDQDQFLIKSCDVDGRFEGFENSEMNKISCVGIICEVLLSNRGHFLYLMNNVNQKLDCKVNENSFELFPGNFWFSPALGEIDVEMFDGKFTLTKKFFVSNENSDFYSKKGSLEFFNQ